MTTSNPFIETSTSILPGVYRYTYVTNNPLKYTDPSGYVFHRYERIQWEEEVSKSSGGGGGYHFDPWILNNGVPQEGFYVDFTGQAYIDGAPVPWSYAADVLGTTIYEAPRDANGDFIDFNQTGDSYAIYENGTKSQERITGLGTYGIIKEGIMVSDGMFPTFGSRAEAEIFVSILTKSFEIRSLFNGGFSFENVWNVIKETSIFPVAYSIEANGSTAAGVASSASPIGGVIAIRGNDRFKAKAFASGGIGVGTLSATAEVIAMRYFYSGDIGNFLIKQFSGPSLDINVTFGEGLVGSVLFSIIPIIENNRFSGDFIIGLGGGLGVGAETTGGAPVSVSGTVQYTRFIN